MFVSAIFLIATFTGLLQVFLIVGIHELITDFFKLAFAFICGNFFYVNIQLFYKALHDLSKIMFR